MNITTSIQQRTNLPGATPLDRAGIKRWLSKNEDRAGEFDGMQTSALVSHIQEYLTAQAQNDSQATTLNSLDGIAEEPPQAANTMPGFVDSESLAETVADGVAGYMNSDGDNGSDDDETYEDAQVNLVESAIDSYLQGLSSPMVEGQITGPNFSYVSQTPDTETPDVDTNPFSPVPISPVIPISPSLPGMPTGLASPLLGISSSANTSKRKIEDKVLANLIDTLPNAPKMAQILGFNLSTGQGVAAFKRYLLQRAQMVQMRATPSNTARAKNNTARPRMFFNRFSSSREIRYT